MEDLQGYPFYYMSEREQKIVWAVAKLLDGLNVKEAEKILNAMSVSIQKDARYQMPRPVSK